MNYSNTKTSHLHITFSSICNPVNYHDCSKLLDTTFPLISSTIIVSYAKVGESMFHRLIFPVGKMPETKAVDNKV